jgi:hypothetical protein
MTFITLLAAMQGASIENPNVKWSDIGGQEDTKRALQEAVEWPITHKAAFRRLGIAPPKGAFCCVTLDCRRCSRVTRVLQVFSCTVLLDAAKLLWQKPLPPNQG